MGRDMSMFYYVLLISLTESIFYIYYYYHLLLRKIVFSLPLTFLPTIYNVQEIRENFLEQEHVSIYLSIYLSI